MSRGCHIGQYMSGLVLGCISKNCKNGKHYIYWKHVCKNFSKIVRYVLIMIIINVVSRFAVYWFIQRRLGGAISISGTRLDPRRGNDVECRSLVHVLKKLTAL